MKIIAEIGLSHEGSLGTAHAYIDAVARAGADVVKFQCHEGDRCDQFRPGTYFPQDKTRQDYWRRTGFTTDQWRELSAHAHDVGLLFCVSVFALEGIAHLSGVEVDLWKVPSSQVSYPPLIRALARLGKPLIVSSGMSDWGELDRAVINSIDAPQLTILHCVTEYPCPPEHVGLNVLGEIRERYPSDAVGLSDHSGTIVPGILAASRGAAMLEVHVCFSRDCFGPDVSASVTIAELRELVQGARYAERLKPMAKGAVDSSEMKRIFRSLDVPH